MLVSGKRGLLGRLTWGIQGWEEGARTLGRSPIPTPTRVLRESRHPTEGDPGLVTCSKLKAQRSGEDGPQQQPLPSLPLVSPYFALPSQQRRQGTPPPRFTNRRPERRPWRRGLWSAAN